MKYLNYILIFVILFGIHGCGYRLAGKADLDAIFDQTHVSRNQASYALVDLVSQQLEVNDVDLVDLESATAIVNILYEYTEKVIQSLDSDGNVREYELILEVRFNVAVPKGEQLLANQEIRLSRDLLFDVNDVLGVQEEERQLYTEMRKDAARLIVYRLQAIHSE